MQPGSEMATSELSMPVCNFSIFDIRYCAFLFWIKSSRPSLADVRRQLFHSGKGNHLDPVRRCVRERPGASVPLLPLLLSFLTQFHIVSTLTFWYRRTPSRLCAARRPIFLRDMYTCRVSFADSTDIRSSRSFACLSNYAVASRVPSCVSSTILARRSLEVDLRTTSPRFSRQSIAAVMEPLASRTFS